MKLGEVVRNVGSMALVDRIKLEDAADLLVYKFPSDQITLGAQLIVSEGQEAIFFQGGQALDLFGPGTHTLSTRNLPLLNKLINLPFGGKTPFSAEIYFVNKTVFSGHDWGTKTPVMLLEPQYRITIPLRAHGQYGIRIISSREFLVQIVGTKVSTSLEETTSTILDAPIRSAMQQALGVFLIEKKISVFELPIHLMQVAEHVKKVFAAHFKTFGIELINFTIESINFDQKDESVVRLRKMLDEVAHLEIMGDAYRRNVDFYRTEKQYEILKGAAESGGAASILAGAAMGVGIGFGVAQPAADFTKRAMEQVLQRELICRRCSAVYKEGDKFCSRCGASLASALNRCGECGAENVQTAMFCATCGRPFGVPGTQSTK
jgi:membrane protease subunit (stomatin/prohibitin family)